MMIGWRRKAKAERARAESPMSAEHLYDLVNQTMLANFGPLGSYAITRRGSSDSDDIFHTMLASSVAHNIVGNLINHNAIPLLPQPAPGGSFVAATGAFAATHALPVQPLPVADLPPLRVGSHAAVDVAAGAPAGYEVVGAPVAAAPVAAAPVATAPVATAPVAAAVAAAAPVAAAVAAAAPVAAAPVAAAPAAAPVAVVSAAPVPVPAVAATILPLPVSAVAVAATGAASLAPIVAVPVSADLAEALTVLDETGPLGVTGPATHPTAETDRPNSARPLVSTEH